MDYKVIKPFGDYKKGALLNSNNREELKIIKRKLQEDVEGDETILPVENVKMNEEKYENKMIEKSEENKKKKGG
jgi:hypothetical protein